MRIRACLATLAGVALLATAARGAVIADSFDDWSFDGTQGEFNWYNGYYNLTADGDGEYEADDFNEFFNEFGPGGGPVDPAGNHWDGGKWDLLAGGGPWTEIGQEGTHPNGTNSAPNEEHWTIRRWVSDHDGEVALIWHVRATNLGGGTGTEGRLYVNGELLDSMAVGGTDGTGVTRVVCATLAEGDIVDLALTPLGPTGDRADGSDGSASRLTIDDEVPDGDDDGVNDCVDNCLADANGDQSDSDGDGVGDVCDNCPDDANVDQADRDGNGIGDACDVVPHADSQADWSTTGTQGERNWYNGYYNLTTDAEPGYSADDFVPFDPEHWRGANFRLVPANAPWTTLGAEDTHPNGTNSAPNQEHWTIRRWESDITGVVKITWHMRETNLAGGGVGGLVFHNGVEIDRVVVPGGDGVGVQRDIVITIAAGDFIDLALTPENADGTRGDGSDGSANLMRIFTDGFEVPDIDEDGVLDPVDNCRTVANGDQADADGDGFGDVCDNCPDAANPEQSDGNGDGIGDACSDIDGDGVADATDNCRTVANADQANADGDAAGDACDLCPDDFDFAQTDRDNDGIGDACEPVWIAHSMDDWSTDGVQGENDWFNGWFNLTQDGDGEYEADDFIEFFNEFGPAGGPVAPEGNHWNGGAWDLLGDAAGPWTVLAQFDSHPNGTNSAPGDEHWTIRRLDVTFSGEVAVHWHLRAQNVGCGGGTGGLLYHNDELVDAAVVGGTDGVGVHRVVILDLSVGDTLDLALTPENTDGSRGDGCDGSGFLLAVTREIPETDGDGVADHLDNCPSTPNADQADADGDGVGDVCDNCRGDANADQLDRDQDGAGDACDTPLVADSVNDWSEDGEQGVNGWFYGYYNLTLDPDQSYEEDDFEEFFNEFGPAGGPTDPFGNHWTGTAWDFTTDAVGPWTFLAREDTHPNGTNSAPNEEHWTIRRWESSVDGEAEVVWNTRKVNPNGTGVTGILFHNGVEVDRATIAGNDTEGVTRTVVLELTRGDLLDLALTPVGVNDDPADGSDGSANWMIVSSEGGGGGNEFVRGDADGSGAINITDGIFILNFLFLGGPAPGCADAADADNSGATNITDGIYVLNFLFLGGPAPSAPHPGCGTDPEGDDDRLTCAASQPGCV